MSRRALVTGGAGFIGSHLIPALQRDGWDVTCYDLQPTTLCDYIHGDVLDPARLAKAVKGQEIVFHLAALADVRSALKVPMQQVDQNFLATATLLEAMRHEGVKRIAFASTAVVYGNAQSVYENGSVWMREDRLPQATSIYGAMKFASESLITSYCYGYGMQANILRLVSVVGTGYKHGNLLDFYLKVKANPTRLDIYGSPAQQKYYVDADDVAEAFRLVTALRAPNANVWNVSSWHPNTIQDSIDVVCRALGASPTVATAEGAWIGDLPALKLSTTRLRSLGWMPRDAYPTMEQTVLDFQRRGL